MNAKFTISIFIFLFPLLLLSQKNDISIDGRYIPCYSYIIGGSINYFRYLSNKGAVGVKLNINTLVTDSDYVIDYYHKTKERYEVNLPSFFSLVFKHDFYKRKRSTFSSDIGLVAYAEIIHHLKERPIFICGVGLPDNYEPPIIKFKEWEINYYLGITAAVNYSYKIIDNLAIGIDLQAMIFAGIEKAESYPCMIPSLRISYKY